MRVLTVDHATPPEIWRALVTVGEALQVDFCIRYGPHYEFEMGGGDHLRVLPERARTVRLDALKDGDLAGTLWRPIDDPESLTAGVVALRQRDGGMTDSSAPGKRMQGA